MPPRMKVKRDPLSSAPVSKSMPSGAPRSTWSLGVKSNLRASPQRRTSTLALSSAAHRHAGLRQVGQAQQHGVEFGLDVLQHRRAFAQAVGDARHLGHRLAAVLALGLELADLLAQGVAPRLQFLDARLQRLAFGLQRAKALHVQEGLRRLARRQAGEHAVQVAPQQVDVEHERSFVKAFGVHARGVHGVRIAANPAPPCCGRPGPAAAGTRRPPAHRAGAAR